MTRAEFLSQQKESERRIVWRVIPLGIIYAIRGMSVVFSIYLAVMLWMYYGTTARNVIVGELIFCVLLFAISFPAERDSKRNFARLGLRCPFCQKFLVFVGGMKAAETGCCDHCGARVFDG
jgi:hypothetical protein